MLELLKNVLETANVAGTSSAVRRPRSRPLLHEDMPLAHTDSSVHLTSFALYFDLEFPLDL